MDNTLPLSSFSIHLGSTGNHFLYQNQSRTETRSVIWLLYGMYLVVGVSFNPFLALAIHCNRRRETLSISNYEVLWTIIFGIQLMQKKF